MRFHRLSKSDTRRLCERAAPLGVGGRAGEAAVLEDEGARLYWLDGLVLAEAGDSLIPVLDERANAKLLESLPSLIVDMGAVAKIAGGADVMGPGVVDIRGVFSAGGLVVARDERNGRALAICRALVDSSMLQPRSRGRVAENIHHLGDRIWRLSERLRELV
ncbi:MAG: PUA domain-containing protein [Nitrososphaerota archaeon]